MQEYGTAEAIFLATVSRPSRPLLVLLSVKKLFILAVAVCVVFLQGHAHAAVSAACGLPDAKLLWIDYAEGSVGFRVEAFGSPGSSPPPRASRCPHSFARRARRPSTGT